MPEGTFLFGYAEDIAAVLIHAYIIGHYNPVARIMNWYLTLITVCALILSVRGGTYSLKS